jgi:GNAT superfamily N-acetyltransferase
LTLNLSHTSIPHQIQANLIAYMRLFAGLPGMTMHDADDAFWFVSNKPAPGNNILRAHFPADHVEAHIDTLFAQIGRHIHEISWLLFPGDQPADLGQRLAARGMPAGPAGIWLWAGLNTLLPAPAVPANFRIEQVRNDEMMAEWVRVSEAGFETALPDYYDAYARHGYGPAAFSLHYTGYLGDTPVTSGTLLDAGGTAALYDISTPLAFRRQGFGAAITYFMMQAIRSRGYTDTWIWSSPLGEGVYQQLGYLPADFGIREHVWRKG